MQKEFVSRYTRYLDSIKTTPARARRRSRRVPSINNSRPKRRPRAKQFKETRNRDRSQRRQIQRKLDAITDPFQNQRGRLTVISYNIETAKGKAKEYRQEAEEKRRKKSKVALPADDGSGSNREDQLRSAREVLRTTCVTKRHCSWTKAELLKEPTEIAKKRDDYLKNHLIGLGPAAIEGLKTKMANYDYSILGHQISVKRLQHRRSLRGLSRRHS